MEPYQTEMGRIHIIKRGDMWAAKRYGAARASFVLAGKRSAIERGRRMKGVSEVIVHRTDGTIQGKSGFPATRENSDASCQHSDAH